MPKFRKKPVVIEAFKWQTDEVPEWWIKASGQFNVDLNTGSVFIPTLEGIHEARPGDFIIRGVQGELYPCKPDIFEMTYQIDEPETVDTTGQVFTYTKRARFGVVNKLPYNQRFHCNFKYLHETRELAEKEALRLTAKYAHKFYIVEIQSITNAEQAA